ncbi:hypothetical protein SteCoe_18967 [Stentor coeruleus]|uniref:LITAF domain-containing protein n=1 Tax=Stentor coeruleus TaxID=5963 RepID=A0A1R2BVF2_9CILI|nr:hypothetical protein SteCoe_18967 [Stentor coeruleus]
MSDSEGEETKNSIRKKPSKPKPPPSSQIKCPQCDSIVETYNSSESTFLTIILSFITILIFGIWSIFLLPFVIPLSKSIVIRCSRCNERLETHQPFGLFSLKDEVQSLKCGECAIVISRSYLLSALSLIICFMVYFWLSTENLSKHIVNLNTTWPEYLEDCGGEVALENTIKVAETFSVKYEGKTISWDGYLMKATENYGWFKGEHAVIILVKMQPSESDIHADLILSMDNEDFLQSRSALASLDRGSHFRFNATFISPGNEEQLHHFHCHSIENIDGFLDIPLHVHNVNHRYTLKTQNAQANIAS